MAIIREAFGVDTDRGDQKWKRLWRYGTNGCVIRKEGLRFNGQNECIGRFWLFLARRAICQFDILGFFFFNFFLLIFIFYLLSFYGGLLFLILYFIYLLSKPSNQRISLFLKCRKHFRKINCNIITAAEKLWRRQLEILKNYISNCLLLIKLYVIDFFFISDYNVICSF